MDDSDVDSSSDEQSPSNNRFDRYADAHLPGYEESAALEFQAVTGLENLERCRELLQAHHGDLQAAVMAFLQWQDNAAAQGVHYDDPGAAASAAHASLLASAAMHYDEGEVEEEQASLMEEFDAIDLRQRRTRASAAVSITPPRLTQVIKAPRPVLSWSRWFGALLSLPFRLVYSSVYEICRFVIGLWRPRPIATNPLHDVNTFRTHFLTTYGSHARVPNLFEGTYSHAINSARTSLQFLLVYLHESANDRCDSFCRDTLCHAEVADLLDSQTLFWACSVDLAEGYRVAQTLRLRIYPSLVLIVPRTERMTVVARFEGLQSPTELVEQLRDFMQSSLNELQLARDRRQEVETSRLLRSQQMSEYEKSLLIDQKKEARRKELAEAARAEVEAAALADSRLEQRAAQLQQRKELLRSVLPAEPPTTESNSVCLQIKLPNGQRLTRRFRCAEPLRYLYAYILCSDGAPDDFQVLRNFPCVVLPCQPSTDDVWTDSSAEVAASLTFADVGLFGAETLYVRDNEA